MISSHKQTIHSPRVMVIQLTRLAIFLDHTAESDHMVFFSVYVLIHRFITLGCWRTSILWTHSVLKRRKRMETPVLGLGRQSTITSIFRFRQVKRKPEIIRHEHLYTKQKKSLLLFFPDHHSVNNQPVANSATVISWSYHAAFLFSSLIGKTSAVSSQMCWFPIRIMDMTIRYPLLLNSMKLNLNAISDWNTFVIENKNQLTTGLYVG